MPEIPKATQRGSHRLPGTPEKSGFRRGGEKRGSNGHGNWPQSHGNRPRSDEKRLDDPERRSALKNSPNRPQTRNLTICGRAANRRPEILARRANSADCPCSRPSDVPSSTHLHLRVPASIKPYSLLSDSSTMNESDAKATLRQLGITPTPELIRNWIRANEVEHKVDAEEPELSKGHLLPPSLAHQSPPISTGEIKSRADGLPHGASNSNLEPVLIEQGTLEKGSSGRKPGRPRIIASWFPAVAQSMADGTSLRVALAINRLYLSKTQMRALYRNVTFKAMHQEARRRFLIEHFGRRPNLEVIIGRFVL